jgi:catalase-peroxidase
LGGLRTININFDDPSYGVLIPTPGSLTNEFFLNLLDMNFAWNPAGQDKVLYIETDCKTGELKWTATRADLVFGSNAELRAIAEIYGSTGNLHKFIAVLVSAWTKAMNLDNSINKTGSPSFS